MCCDLRARGCCEVARRLPLFSPHGNSGFMQGKYAPKSSIPQIITGDSSSTRFAAPSFNNRRLALDPVIWDDGVDRKLRHMYAELASAEACAAQLGVSARHVRRRLRLLGLVVSSAITRGSGLNPRYRTRQLESISVRWSAEMDETLRALRDQGASLSACANELNVSDGTIRKRLDQLGLPRRIPRRGT